MSSPARRWLLAALLFSAALAPVTDRPLPDSDGDRYLPPGAARADGRFWLGTDRLGRDLLTRVLAATRRTLLTVFAAASLAVCAGGALGAVAGWSGGLLEKAIVHSVNLWTAAPKLFLVLAVAGTISPTPPLVVLLLAAISWTPPARILRAEVRELKHRPFIEATVATGVGPCRLAIRHLAPRLLPLAASSAALLVGELVVLESALSFLGAGLPPSTPGLGTLIQHAAEDPTGPWWPVVFPGLAAVGSSWIAFRAASNGESPSRSTATLRR